MKKDSGFRLQELESQFQCLLVVWLWASHSNSSCLSFLRGCWKDSILKGRQSTWEDTLHLVSACKKLVIILGKLVGFFFLADDIFLVILLTHLFYLHSLGCCQVSFNFYLYLVYLLVLNYLKSYHLCFQPGTAALVFAMTSWIDSKLMTFCEPIRELKPQDNHPRIWRDVGCSLKKWGVQWAQKF